jgi:hypothetical protein
LHLRERLSEGVRRLRDLTPQTATFGVFFADGAVVGTWIGHIPWIKSRFDLSNSALGLVLLVMSIGVMAVLPVMGQAIVRLGSARSTSYTGLACVIALPLLVLAPKLWILLPFGLAFGASTGALDLSMNAHGVAVERARRRPIMSSLHAGWSLGALTAAGLVAAGNAIGLDPRVETVAAASAYSLLLVTCLRRLGDGSVMAKRSAGFARPSRGVITLAALCMVVMITEGAMADWGGVYLTRNLGTGTAMAALAFAGFSGGMTLGRLVGDKLNGGLGATRLMRVGTAVAAFSLGVLLLIGIPAIAIAGFFLVGLGIANGVPLLFSAAGHEPGRESGPNIAAVSFLGSLGFLVGPPFVGFLADATSLPIALSTLCPGLVVVALLARGAAASVPTYVGSAVGRLL